MLAQRLDNTPVPVPPSAVAGQDTETAGGLVRHLGFVVDGSGSMSSGDTIRVYHMGPPLETGRHMKVHCLGWIPLSQDETEEVRNWIDEREYEYKRQRVNQPNQYIILPHMHISRFPNGAVRHYRFSCSGFIIEAFREIGIDLVETDESKLPAITYQQLTEIYPEVARTPHMFHRFGLTGNGPWPIVLCGYVMHAFDRTEGEIRGSAYLPIAGDELFG